MAEVSVVQTFISLGSGLVTGYLGSLVSDRRKQFNERRSVAQALFVEIDHLTTHFQAVSQDDMNASLEEVKNGIVEANLQVYVSNLSKIGLLEPNTVFSVVNFYVETRKCMALEIEERNTSPSPHRDKLFIKARELAFARPSLLSDLRREMGVAPFEKLQWMFIKYRSKLKHG